MEQAENHYQNVSLLITHYNRSASLERLLLSAIAAKCSFGSIVVSDDCSRPEHLEKLNEIKTTYNFKLVTTPKNGGLGNNINKGQDVIATPYTLYVQEDFVFAAGTAPHLADALDMMDNRQDLDVARFYAYFRYPYLKGLVKGFSEMYFSPWLKGYLKFYEYSDHPHLRRDTFVKKFGRYVEGLNPEKTEYMMMFSFLQKKGTGIFYNDFKNLFVQENTAEEPSTMERNALLRGNNPVIVVLRELYRHIRFNYDYRFLKTRA